MASRYGVATISRMLKNIGLFCKRALQKRPVFCKETCIFKHPTHRSHPILVRCTASKYAWEIRTHSSRSWLTPSSEAQILKVESETHSSRSWLHSSHSGVIHLVRDWLLPLQPRYVGVEFETHSGVIRLVRDCLVPLKPRYLESNSRLIHLIHDYILYTREWFISFVTLSSTAQLF